MDMTFKKQNTEGAQIASELDVGARMNSLDFSSVNNQNNQSNKPAELNPTAAASIMPSISSPTGAAAS